MDPAESLYSLQERLNLLDHPLIGRAIDPLSLLLTVDESGIPQLFEVVRNGGERQIKMLGDLRDIAPYLRFGQGTIRAASLTDQLEDGQSVLIGEGLEDLG